MKRDAHYLAHIIDAIEFILDTTSKAAKADFLEDRLMRDAVIRNLEVVGEAVKHLSLSLRSKHKDIEWKRIAGMRDVLIHEYFGVDHEKVWNVVVRRLPKLLKRLKAIVHEGF